MSYPTVDSEFVIEKIISSGKVIIESQLTVGKTTSFVLKGDLPIHKRIVYVREFEGQVNFMHATALAILYGFMGDLLEWYRENRKWNEGGYFV